MSLVFISYKRENSEIAQQVKTVLDENDFLGWVDTNKLNGGDDWKLVIDTAIKNSIAVIVIVTPLSIASTNVTYEWSFAMGAGIRVIPLIFETSDKENPMHSKLEALHRHDFTKSDKPWGKLLSDLDVIKNETVVPEEIYEAARLLRSSKSKDELNYAMKILEEYRHDKAAEELFKATKSGIPEISIMAALALSRKSLFKDTRAISALEKALQNPQLSTYHLEAAKTLGMIGTDEAVNVLLRIYEGLEPRTLLALSMPKILRTARNYLVKDFFRNLLKEDSIHMNELVEVIAALGELRIAEELDKMRHFADNVNQTEIRESALISFAQIGGEQVLPELKKRLQKLVDTNGGSFPQAHIRAFIEIGTPSAIQFLKEIAEKYPQKWIGRAINGSLENIKS